MSAAAEKAKAAHDQRGHGAAIQPAEKQPSEPQFLPIVAKLAPAVRKANASPKPKLTRVTFTVSRLMEFCSKRELINQTGHSDRDWPLVVVKELFDNALDACEEADIAPVITVTVAADRIVVEDNAGGIDAATITSVLDYTVRVSSREAYVSPTRGAQGNALKTILAMSYVLQTAQLGSYLRLRQGPPIGLTIIETRGIAHRIEFSADHINNQPKISHTTTPSLVITGTRFTVHWPATQLLDLVKAQFITLVANYVWFNPHLTLRATWFGETFATVEATNPAWEKWRPTDPTSAHWYDLPRFQRYLAAHVARDRDLGRSRPVRAFIGEFRGLSGTAVQKKILDEVGCSHQSLATFFGIEQANRDDIARLLAAMQRYSKPVAPKHLGIIGAEHFRSRFLLSGGAAETFKYNCRKHIRDDGIPYVIETATGVRQSAITGQSGIHRIDINGANWSAAIGNPFRFFGHTGEGLEAALSRMRAGAGQPVICAVHLACALIQYLDRGKSSISLTDNVEVRDE